MNDNDDDGCSLSAFIENIKFEIEVLITRVDDWEAYHPQTAMNIALVVFNMAVLIMLIYLLFFYKG